MEKYTVVLDPGHGGTSLDGGSTPNNATGKNGLLEKDLTLGIAKKVAERLPANRFQTILTRSDDRNLPLSARAGKAREAGADAFVSIHFNGHRDTAHDGTEVFISNTSDEKDWELANELLKAVSPSTAGVPGGVRKTDFTVLKGDFHVAKTAACLIEMAYLTNPAQAQKLSSPSYVDHLAAAVAQSIETYSHRLSYAKSLAEDDSKSEKTIVNVRKEHADPKNFPIDLPEPGKGTDSIKVNIPNGLKFSRWEVEILATSIGSGYEVAQSPQTGAEGSHKIDVEWWHLPYGKFEYRLKAYASPDGKSSAVEKIVFDKAGWMEKAKDQVSQGQALQLAVKGEKAKQIYEAIQKHQASQGKNAQQSSYGDIAIAMEPITITVVVLVGIVIFGILVALGLLTLGAIIKMALDKGYNIKDTKFKAGVGEGQLRQDHEIAFNLTKPNTT
ncbi:MAG: N-acetylmuramoyl-L-alanine amidase [Saprospiraceae bacterium]|nr:N-acetylmuramoyl-L-alanine amidase [Pyrinomonadaceae bacterium]